MSGRIPKTEALKIAEECKNNIDKLVELYYETDPQKGTATEKDKFNKAITALNLASNLPSHLTQWAESHVIGYFQDESENPDCHAYESTDEKPDIKAYRSAIAVILNKSLPSHVIGYNSPMYHHWREALAECLIALNKGETFPLIEASIYKKQPKKYTTDLVRTATVLHVYRLWGKLGKKHKALEAVASKICTSKENIQKWEKQILKTEDPDRHIRNAVKTGYKIAQERNEKRNEMKFLLSDTEFPSAWICACSIRRLNCPRSAAVICFVDFTHHFCDMPRFQHPNDPAGMSPP